MAIDLTNFEKIERTNRCQRVWLSKVSLTSFNKKNKNHGTHECKLQQRHNGKHRCIICKAKSSFTKAELIERNKL